MNPEHDRHAFVVRPFDHGVVGDLQFPAQQVQAEIFGVAHDVRVPLRVVAEEQVGRVHAAANQVIAAIDFQVEIAAGPDVRKTVVRIAGLRNLANAEVDRLGVRHLGLVVSFEFEFEMVEFRFSPLIRPPQIGILHRELSIFGRRERDLFGLVSQQPDILLELDRLLAGT